MNTKRNTGLCICTIILSVCINSSIQAEDHSKKPYDIEKFIIPSNLVNEIGNYRNSWIRLTGFEYSGLHWNQFVIIYIKENDGTYKHNYFQYINWYEDPDDEENNPEYINYTSGTVFVKENLSSHQGKPDKALSVTAMIKRDPGFSPNYGDWEYVQFNTKGKIIIQGKAEDPLVYKTCAECHINVANRDYIFSLIYKGLSIEQ